MANKYLDQTGLQCLITRIKALVSSRAAATHTHAATDLSAGILPLSRGGTGQSTALTAATALGRGYGTCATAATTAAKLGVLAGFSLAAGAVVAIKFAYTNTAASPTLNVNSSGAKPVYDWRTGTYPAVGSMCEAAGAVHLFVYNGAQWILLNPVTRKVWASVAVSATGWTKNSSTGYYTKTVTVSGMRATDYPHSVDIVRSTDAAADALCEEAFGCVDRVITQNGSIQLRAPSSAPGLAFNLRIETSR